MLGDLDEGFNICLEADFSSSLADEFSSPGVNSPILVKVEDIQISINGELSNAVDQSGHVSCQAILPSSGANDLSSFISDLSIHIDDEYSFDSIDFILHSGDAQLVDKVVHIASEANFASSLADDCA